MLILHQIGKTIPYDFEKWYIVRKIDDDLKSHVFYHVPELSPSQNLFLRYRELARSNKWNKQTFESIYLPCFLIEIKQKAPFSILQELVEKSFTKNIALCCYCDNEEICHRSIVGGILKGMGANIDCPQEYIKYFAMINE